MGASAFPTIPALFERPEHFRLVELPHRFRIKRLQPFHVTIRLRTDHRDLLVSTSKVTRRPLFALRVKLLGNAEHITACEINRALPRFTILPRDDRDEQIPSIIFHVLLEQLAHDGALLIVAGHEEVQQRFMPVDRPGP